MALSVRVVSLKPVAPCKRVPGSSTLLATSARLLGLPVGVRLSAGTPDNDCCLSGVPFPLDSIAILLALHMMRHIS
jgi:hypothetical protein